MEKQELYCHGCDRYVQFEIDMELEGRHMLECPSCGHKHYRVVVDGNITDGRWGPSAANMPTYTIAPSTTSSTSTSTYDTISSSSVFSQVGVSFLYGAWMDTTASSTSGSWSY